MSRSFQGIVLRGFGARDHQATVLETVKLAPRAHQDGVTDPVRDVVAEPTAWLRFWFPDPDGGSTQFQRAYTLTEADPESGPVRRGRRAARASRPGFEMGALFVVAAPPSSDDVGVGQFRVADEPPSGYLLIGDAASTPAINGIIGAVPADIPIEVYLEQHDNADALIPIAEHPRLRLHRSEPTRRFLAGERAIEARDWSNWYCWVTRKPRRR